ncbi:MAG: hypothetical protein ACKO7B_12120, partial [Flavobacteriales bacterium]
MKSFYSFLCCALFANVAWSQTNLEVVSQAGSQVQLTCTVQNYTINHDGIYTDIQFEEGTPI